jgi:hypothetical protein
MGTVRPYIVPTLGRLKPQGTRPSARVRGFYRDLLHAQLAPVTGHKLHVVFKRSKLATT